MRRFVAALLLLPLISACSGGGATSARAPDILRPTSIADNESPLSEARSDAMLQDGVTPVPYSADLLYVGNANHSITVYQHDAQGNAAPKYVIAGSRTGITGPGALSQDGQSNLYVANVDSILVFAHGASGNVAPIRKLAGPLTGLHQIGAMTVDKTTGKIFVSDTLPTPAFPSSSILRFPPNANGNQAPFARSTAAADIFDFTSDSTGKNLIVASSGSTDNVGLTVQTVGKQFANGTALQGTYTLNRISALVIADDPASKTFLMRDFLNGHDIRRFAENTVSTYSSQYGLEFKPAMISDITSDSCGSGIAVGYISRFYVTHSQASGCSTDAVYVYNPDANGNATPVRILTGPATKLYRPGAIYEGK